ncbi:aldehyde dehydrogenase family protein [Microbacterium awajiense]|uniref:Aldehyde dehydrogenase family protein n=1 Tax=Microbacterium awajiense TaxID=415214 RepID=A0ABP7AMI7_9MICO
MSPTTPAKKPHPAASRERAANAPDIADDERERLDDALHALGEGRHLWPHLTLTQRMRLLERLHETLAAHAEEWAETAAAIAGLAPDSPLRGEVWLEGPHNAVTTVDALRATLAKLAAGRSPLDGVDLEPAPGDRLRAHAFPLSAADSLLLSGFTGEVWFEPGATADELRAAAGLGQLTPTEPAELGLVLGAGNVASIPFADVLSELFAHNRVILLKVNPTHDRLLPVFERVLAPLIEPGLVRVVRGGAEAGAYLTRHPAVEHVHITGAAATLERIVWGTGPQAKRRRRENRPLVRTPISAELGGVSPIIVVPGRWTDADLAYQAENIATMRLENSGHNCIAGQVVMISADWDQRDAFLAALRHAYGSAPHRTPWYPGAQSRLDAAASDYPDAAWFADRTRALVEIDDADPRALEQTEYFAPVLGVVSIPGNGQEFLDAAVARANSALAGTLGANVLIDPDTEAALGEGFERAIAELRYGAIAINTWTAFVFMMPTLTWGAYPGNTLQDPGSGIGIVHNALLLDRVERSIGRGPFRPFPRSAGAIAGPGRFSVLPKPPWFVTSRTGASVCEDFTRYRLAPNARTLSRIVTGALRS